MNIDKNKVASWLGADRAARLEKISPGAIDAGIARASAEPNSDIAVSKAAIRALQSAGIAPGPRDMERHEAICDGKPDPGPAKPVQVVPAPVVAPNPAPAPTPAPESPDPQPPKSGKGKADPKNS